MDFLDLKSHGIHVYANVGIVKDVGKSLGKQS